MSLRSPIYFFKLSQYVPALLEHFETNPTFVQPDARRNEIVNRIKEAQDVPISRTGTGGWGIPVPGDPEQSIYVWIDALFKRQLRGMATQRPREQREQLRTEVHEAFSDERRATVSALRAVGRPVTYTSIALCLGFLMLVTSEFRTRSSRTSA